MDNKTKGKKRTKRYDNLYIFVQIVASAILILICVILRVKNEEIFYRVKEDYDAFFAVDTIYESNFSYKSFMDKMKEETKEKYDQFMQTMAHLYGKGANDTYPSNISVEKFVPKEKGLMPLNGYITSRFGIRKNPFDSKSKDFHTGIDIANEKGVFIKAAFDGVVLNTGYTDISGNYIKIQSENEIQTFYGHIQFSFVNIGDRVLKGQVIATVGDTGLVTGPHLHFEVLHKGNRVNPVYTVE